jgi:hypothetical protein
VGILHRFEMPSSAIFLTASLASFVGVFLLEARSRARGAFRKGVFTGALLVALVTATFGAQWMIDRWWWGLAGHGLILEFPGWLFLITPASAAIVIAAACLLFRTIEWRFSMVLFVTTFAALNLVNWCNPGWCGSFGFPLRYAWWSDSIMIMNGVNLSAGTSFLSLAVNIAGGLGMVALLVRSSRDSARAPVSPPRSTSS